jgi:hypothetical protein
MTSERADRPACSGASRSGELRRPAALSRPPIPRRRPESGRGALRCICGLGAGSGCSQPPRSAPPPEHEEAVELHGTRSHGQRSGPFERPGAQQRAMADRTLLEMGRKRLRRRLDAAANPLDGPGVDAARTSINALTGLEPGAVGGSVLATWPALSRGVPWRSTTRRRSASCGPRPMAPRSWGVIRCPNHPLKARHNVGARQFWAPRRSRASRSRRSSFPSPRGRVNGG